MLVGPSDTELMGRIQRDDADALGELFDRYAPRVYGLARAVCRQSGMADDVVQETFISIWRSRSTCQLQDVDVGAWTMGIVRHRSIDAIRRDWVHERRRDHSYALNGYAAPGDIAVDAAVRDEADHLRRLLAELPEAQREVITLAYYGELTHVEIATLLDIPLGTVKGRMRLGLRRLRDCL